MKKRFKIFNPAINLDIFVVDGNNENSQSTRSVNGNVILDFFQCKNISYVAII